MTTERLPPRIRNINFEDITHTPGFKDLPMEVMGKDSEYRLSFGNVVGKVHGSRVSMAPDINIGVENFGNYQQCWNPVTRRLSLVRYTKAVQAVYFKHFLEGLVGTDAEAKRYHHLETYSDGFSGGFPRTVPEGTYVIKPATGARSMGIITIDTKKIHIREFANLLDMSIRDYSEARDEHVALSEKGSEPPKPLPTKTEWLEDFLKKHNLAYNRGIEYSKDEAAQKIFSRELIVQEFNHHEIDAATFELRALRCVNAPPLIYERQDLAEDYVGYSKEFNRNKIPADLYEEISAVLRHKDFPNLFGSVDIWVNPTSKVWGIYEYQPEYCSVNIRDEDHVAFLEMALDGLWEYCYG